MFFFLFCFVHCMTVFLPQDLGITKVGHLKRIQQAIRDLILSMGEKENSATWRAFFLKIFFSTWEPIFFMCIVSHHWQWRWSFISYFPRRPALLKIFVNNFLILLLNANFGRILFDRDEQEHTYCTLHKMNGKATGNLFRKLATRIYDEESFYSK